MCEQNFFLKKACRGSKEEVLPDDGDSDEFLEIYIPKNAELFVAYSSYSNYKSYGSIEGSPFIQAITEIFSEFGDNGDLNSLFTLINRYVSKKFVKLSVEKGGKTETINVCQTPEFRSTLTQLVKFHRKN